MTTQNTFFRGHGIPSFSDEYGFVVLKNSNPIAADPDFDSYSWSDAFEHTFALSSNEDTRDDLSVAQVLSNLADLLDLLAVKPGKIQTEEHTRVSNVLKQVFKM
jgi:hypothetical protein